MKEYDFVVIGSGIAGLTFALTNPRGTFPGFFKGMSLAHGTPLRVTMSSVPASTSSRSFERCVFAS